MTDLSAGLNERVDIAAIDDAIQRSTGSAGFGITDDGFAAKPFARLLAEKLSLARALFGDEVNLASGSVIRTLAEVSALEDARTWSTLAVQFDDGYVTSARGMALTALGEELGLSRPFRHAEGWVKLSIIGELPPGVDGIQLPRGSRLTSPGGHHVALAEWVVLSATNPKRRVPVVAFRPGPAHNLDPASDNGSATFPQKLTRFDPADPKVTPLLTMEETEGRELVKIEHLEPLHGGELRWPDDRYRSLLLRAPRSLWTVDAVQTAVSMVPGVRQAQVHDGWGGLDLNQSIFGNFNFIERLFSSERDLGSPYYFTVLVAATEAAVWDGPGGLRTEIETAIDDVRPIGLFPRIEEADDVYVGIEADLVVRGLPLPIGSRDSVNSSQPAGTLKARLARRLTDYVDRLSFGEPVRSAELITCLMEEPGVVDARDVHILRYPPPLAGEWGREPSRRHHAERLPIAANLEVAANQIATFVQRDDLLRIV